MRSARAFVAVVAFDPVGLAPIRWWINDDAAVGVTDFVDIGELGIAPRPAARLPVPPGG